MYIVTMTANDEPEQRKAYLRIDYSHIHPQDAIYRTFKLESASKWELQSEAESVVATCDAMPSRGTVFTFAIEEA